MNADSKSFKLVILVHSVMKDMEIFEIKLNVFNWKRDLRVY